MSVTVADCLALPSLKEAAIAGGSAGLNKIVASVTVLEYAEVSLLGEDLFVPNEMVITAFVSAKDDPDVQCKVMRHMCENGVVVFVLYYIGIIVPKLDKKLIDVADELGMPLITMPHGRMDFRYSDVISEVVELILYDNLHEKYFVPTIIERVAQFPERQRNIDNVLRILSDRFHVSIIVTDEQMHLVSKAQWPMTGTFDPERLIACIGESKAAFQHGKTTEIRFDNQTLSMFYSAVYLGKNQRMYVFVALEGDTQLLTPLDKNTLMQISESIQLIMSMQKYSDWSQSSNLLVNAIMNDDAYRTNQIATQSGIDMKSIHNMWVLIVSEAGEESRAEMLTTNKMLQAKSFISDRHKTAFVGSYEESIICLMSDVQDLEGAEAAPFEFMDEVCTDGDMVLLSFSDLQTRMDARKAYDLALEGWFALKTIYRNRAVFFRQELNFALTCLETLNMEDGRAKEHMAVLEPLLASGGGNASEAVDTLSVFMLDAGSSVVETAKQMHIHPNTVKYRLKDIRQKLKRDVTKLPDAYELYLAVALNRLAYTI